MKICNFDLIYHLMISEYRVRRDEDNVTIIGGIWKIHKELYFPSATAHKTQER